MRAERPMLIAFVGLALTSGATFKEVITVRLLQVQSKGAPSRAF